MHKLPLLIVGIVIITACTNSPKSPQAAKSFIGEATIDQSIEDLIAEHGEENTAGINKGVKQLASLWRQEDGGPEEFQAFIAEHYIGDPGEREQVFEKVSRNLEILYGHFSKIILDLQVPLQLDIGPIHPIDQSFGSYDPGTHLSEDFYKNRIAFLIALNFPRYSLAEKSGLGPSWSRQQWAFARLGDVFTSRVPPELEQRSMEVVTASDMYISDYNIYVGQLLGRENRALFEPGLKLLLHWNLRDEIKSNYAGDGLEKQRLIYQAMKRIISQEIPAAFINSEEYTWNPYSNECFKDGQPVESEPEPDERYRQILDNFVANKAMDPYEPELNTFILRSFDGEKEISREEVEKLFTDYISSPLLKDVAELIKNNLGRDLEAFDIWYDGFKPRSGIDENRLNAITRAKYPDPAAFEKDLPAILARLGFPRDRAVEITSKIEVDPARGSGHAWGPSMKSDNAHLRTRVGKEGMDYKGYNIAIHEFGHNVEQTISLQDVDYYMLNGVPSTAFTEALAFVFQKQDLKLLGLDQPDPLYQQKEVLDDFWSTFEIMGVSLVDMYMWNWMYDHPEAAPGELKEATVRISMEVWNEYFAPVLGIRDEPILAIYSHMISNPLYLSNYAVGSLIQFQVEQYLKGKDFAGEVERIYSLGRLTPQEWMRQAVGSEISADPMLSAAEEALKSISSQ